MSKSYNDCLSTRIRHGNATPKEEALADAAPDLLAACKDLLAFFDCARPGGRLLMTDPDAEAARAAIAKAEGGAA